MDSRDEDGGKLEILRLMATASLDTAPVGEVDMGDELEDDEADCYHLNKKSECSLWWCKGSVPRSCDPRCCT